MKNKTHMEGKTVLITGANSGIGFVTAQKLAGMGAKVILACRSQEKAEAAMSAIKTTQPEARLQFLSLDLANLKKVREAANKILESETRLDVLINNAGLFGTRGVTQDGFEMHFATNHLGPYLFTRLLIPLLKQTAPSRIIIVSSDGHYSARKMNYDHFRGFTRSRWSFPEYATSKLCNVLFSKSLAKHVESDGISVYSLHPGIIASEIWRNFPRPVRWLVTLPMISNEQGAITTLHCATEIKLANETGLYYDKCRPKTPSKLARDPELAKKLWIQSAEWTGL